ncbi:MAG TPA: alpha-galactosidase [Mycobacteriales bacterium]|nr:alpha-galactosidase [Mycobacteriales bacterium]
MRRLLCLVAVTAVVGPATVALATPHNIAGNTVTRQGVSATVTPGGATLSNGVVSRSWLFGSDGSVRTTELTAAGGHNWAAAGPDFSLTIDGVPTSSTTGWALAEVKPVEPPVLPGQLGSERGEALFFRYVAGSAALPSGIELDRWVILHPGAGVLETRSTLAAGPAALRVSSYSLDQVTAADPALPAEVQAYNDGSDWRDDYRHVSNPTGVFDAEGEVVRFGDEAGFFLVSQRRGGAMSRVGRDAGGRSWVGVDWARDVFDYGPLQTSPPTYNRLENPAYPVPVRARLVQPLTTLDLGTSFAGVYSGGAAEAAATFSSDFVGAVEPDFARTVGLNTFHPWSHGDAMSDPSLRAQVDRLAALGGETFMLDDQWQGGPGGESGDWHFDPARFPDTDGDGVPDFVSYVQSKGLKLGLWMSPLEFNGASTTYAAHPDWACAPIGDLTAQVPDDAGLGVWDATNPAFKSYLLGVVHRLATDYQVAEFKFDFMAWVDCAPHDYADYEDAFVSLVRKMRDQNPGVTFELDETNDQRAWPFESAALGPSWFDNMHLHGSTQVAKLLHDVWSAAPWVPTWSLGVGTFDGTLTGPYDGAAGVDALFPLAMLTHITFWTDLTKLTAAEQAETAWWVSWYRVHRDELGPAVYELTTTDPLDGQSWAAWQPWSGNRGYVFAFRQAGGPDTASLALQAVDPATSYTVTDVHSGAVVGTFTGQQLRDGLQVSLPAYAAQVLAVTPV